MSSSDKQNYALRLSDIGKEPRRMRPPIQGYEKMPLVTLEKAVEPLISIVSGIEYMAWYVKQCCTNSLNNLSSDEWASIMLYTMGSSPEDSLYIKLNNTLRDEDQYLLRPWYLYLKLFITALWKIRSKRLFLHRGVKKDLSAHYRTGEIVVWWACSSCTSSIHVLENETFLGKTGKRTLFEIDCHSGKDIRPYSVYKKEDEILLLPARQFKVISSMDMGNDLHIIKLEEIDSSPSLLAPPDMDDDLHFIKLEEVDSSPSILAPLDISLFSPPPSNPSMEIQNISPEKISRIEQIISKCSPNNINLSGQQLDDQDVEIIVKNGIISKQCIKLNLMYNEFTQRGISILVYALHNNTCLEELNISRNSISDSGSRLLASVINSSILKRIDLEANNISDEGAKYLAEMLETNTNLLQLSLSVNKICSYGVTMLAKALTNDNTRLESLNLSANTDIKDEIINSVVGMMEHNQSLKKLDLRHCDLSEDGKAKLRAAAKLKKGFVLWLSNSM